MKIKTCSLNPVVDYFQTKRPMGWQDGYAQVVVEIGFGMGEVLIQNAENSPDKIFIGIEQQWQRTYRMLGALDRRNQKLSTDKKIKNVRSLDVDAWVAFERLFPSETIDHIYCLFPCPWPKKGHVKYRLFSNQFLKLLNNRLKQKGDITLVTDFYPYFKWVKEQIDPKDFSINDGVVQTQFQTKYERKWKAQGQEDFFRLDLIKNQHCDVAVKEDVEMRTYKLDNFNPEKFHFDIVKGDITVILKEKMYDQKEKKMFLRVIVSEEHLSQNFWINIFESQGFWRICKAEGQNIFPTPGINRAIDEVYYAAKKNT